MMLDYQSLLLALGLSAACLMVTLFGTWVSRRTESFLLTLVAALALTISGILTYNLYGSHMGAILGAVAYSLLMGGFSVIYAASIQFRTGIKPWRVAGLLALVTIAAGAPCMLVGLNGLGLVIMNVATAILLAGTAHQYWCARTEAPVPLTGMSVLYLMSATTFALCATMLIANGEWTLARVPDNWAENLNIGVCIAGMTGIGALSLALHQWRLAAHHRREALTDPLTGLLNRRALFEQHGTRVLGVSSAIIVLDIDRFKSINDQFGHACGDLVLKAFAEDLHAVLGRDSTATRLGGEEFAVLIDNVMPGRAELIATDVLQRFASRRIVFERGIVQPTVSAGVATGTQAGSPFETVLSQADAALYEAKRAGRNRVEMAGYLHPVVDNDSENRTSA
ncbi:MAG: GGDEF domain-containing protein [Neorhizobium sp.]|jgi:diguanylate cyclase (GGDEF)-like protein|nr:GGDEF domain-containing protein [Neorhizobium sp.]